MPATNRKKSLPPEVRRVPHVKQWLVTGFVLFHLVAITVFAIPINPRSLSAIREMLSPYVLFIGMNESWDTFAPRPKSSEQYLKAIVLTASGDSKIYSFPRMEELSWLDRYRQERYRKFVESILCKDCSGLWPDIEKSVARREFVKADPPEKVILVDFESPIDPETVANGDDADAEPTVLTELFLQPEDLR